MQIITYEQVKNKILKIRNEAIILDSDAAELYGVETKRVNEAVSRNIEKFPDGYLIELTASEKDELVANCDRFNKLKHSTALPKGFTERGLYMLATIIKSDKATETTIAIIDTFAKVRELGRMINQVQELPENSPNQKQLMERTGDLISQILFIDDDLNVVGSETTYEMNLALVKIKKTIKKAK